MRPKAPPVCSPVAFIITSVPKNHTAWPSSLASAYGRVPISIASPPLVGSCQSENPTVAESEVYPLYELVRDLFQRISENSVKAKFAFWGFSEVRVTGVLRTSPFGDSRKFGL